jgi:hypothetical protein
MDVIKPKARSARYEAASPDVGSEPARSAACGAFTRVGSGR